VRIGEVSGLGTPQGTVAFNLYFVAGPPVSDPSTACTGSTPVFNEHGLSNDTLDSSGVATSLGYAIDSSKLGTYYWQDVYTPASGSNYTAKTETCGVEAVTAVTARISITPHEAFNQLGQDHVLTATVEWTPPANSSTWSSAGAPQSGSWAPVGNALVTFSLNSGTHATFNSSVNTCTTSTGGTGNPPTGTCTVTISDGTAEDVTIHATSTFGVTGVTGGSTAFTRSTDTSASCSADTCDAIKHYFSASTTLTVQDQLVGLPSVAGGTVTYTYYADAASCGSSTGGTDATPSTSTVVLGAAPLSKSVSVAKGSAAWFRATYSGDLTHHVAGFTTGCTEQVASN
jgi:hypothetical protein